MTVSHLEVNGRRYAWPSTPVVGLCIDGSQPAYDGAPGYIEEAVAAGVAPYFGSMMANGTSRLGDCVVPTFTNPNNLSIVTGRPPSVHGICGNFFYDPEADTEVMMNDPALMRSGTLFQAFQAAGAKIAAITAKDKLRRLLAHGLSFGEDGAICFSAEYADQASIAEHGIDGLLDLVGQPVPDVYSAALSEFVMAAGVKIMERHRPDILYLSTTDYIQHKHAPGTPVANQFYAMMDGYLAALDAAGAIIVVTADHGMNAKHGADGAPDVLFLQDLLDGDLGPGAARVILPITDPYVAHHGALGSFATVYLDNGIDRGEVLASLGAQPGVALVLDREAAAARFELPSDRLGDIVVIGAQSKVLGTSPDRHDVSGLNEPLRSHGGLTEQKVPVMMNRPSRRPDEGLRNFDIFHMALNDIA